MAAGGGGSWKVAYADFVTAMMALFMVLWITNQDESVKGAVQEYFDNPWTAAAKDSTGIIPVRDADVVKSRKANFENPSVVPLHVIRRINEDLIKAFVQNPEYRDHKSLHIEQTSEGLKINFLDSPSQPIFEKDSPEFTEYGKFVFDTVAWEVARYPSTEIELEGHTEKNYKGPRADYGAWEISSERANVARKRLLSNGVRDTQIQKLSGHADTKPLRTRPPDDVGQRRVTILLRTAKEPE